jgi:hypothetical protein
VCASAGTSVISADRHLETHLIVSSTVQAVIKRTFFSHSLSLFLSLTND